MDLYVLDFETFYSKDYSLTRLTTEEYVRSPLFETIGLGIKKNDGPTYWLAGEKRVAHTLARIDWSGAAILCHNTMFDGAILSWRYGVKPKVWFDTLCMARAIHGVEKSASLKALAEKYGVGEKGDEVINALGKRIVNFTTEELARYGEYCRNDVELTYTIFNQMIKKFPKQELKLIDHTLRMFIDPILELDGDLLEMHLQKTKLIKEDLLTASGVTKEDLMSNAKLAAVLRSYGAEVPMKVSPTTGKLTYAMAKNDEEFKALAEHEDFRVQAAVAARLGTKSTLEETRTQRFIDISKRGALAVPLRYYAAHTGRWGGCLVADTEVVVLDATRGVCNKRIVDVLLDDLVWDGTAFVAHEGVVFSGYSEVIEWDGVMGTAEHVVFTDAGEISLRDAREGGHHIKTTRHPDQYDVDAALRRDRFHEE